MKINEITEALPGAPGSRDLRQFRASQEKLIAANVDKGIRAWLYKIKELTVAGKLSDQSTTEEYVDYFIAFVAGRARINPGHPKLTEIKDEFLRDLKSTPNNKRANMSHLKKAIYNIVKTNMQGDFSNSEKKNASTSVSSKTPGFKTKASDGQTYEWLGRQWKNMATGRIATRAIAAELNKAFP